MKAPFELLELTWWETEFCSLARVALVDYLREVTAGLVIEPDLAGVRQSRDAKNIGPEEWPSPLVWPWIESEGSGDLKTPCASINPIRYFGR